MNREKPWRHAVDSMPAVVSPVVSFSALTLLVGHQEEHLACKNWVMRCWCGRADCIAPSGAIQIVCILFSWCHCHPKTPSSLALMLVLPFWCWLTQVVLEKRPLNGCSSSSSSSSCVSSSCRLFTTCSSCIIHVIAGDWNAVVTLPGCQMHYVFDLYDCVCVHVPCGVSECVDLCCA